MLNAPRASAADAGSAADIGEAFASDAAGLKRSLARRGACDDAEDIVQESFLRLLGREGLQRPSAYAARIAFNLLRDRARQMLRRRQVDNFPSAPSR